MADAAGEPMKVVMCHGTWDLLHPGHVAHLQEARAMGDYLIVGVTADEHVQKGPGRPAVRDVDRANAVAALRCVDNVIVDHHPTPKEMIEVWKPDIFVKGADYIGQNIPEGRWVTQVGGHIAFTKGDTMYHSRQWLHTDARAALEAANLLPGELWEILDAAPSVRVHVIGDLIVDAYVQGELIGPMTLLVEPSENWVGGAGAVALHAAGAGAGVSLSCPIGDDAAGDWAGETLTAADVTLTVLDVATTPTKGRYYRREGGLFCQLDFVDSTPLDAARIASLAESLRTVPTDAVICADYRHGVFHADSLPVLRAAIPENALKVADSQVASRWGNIKDFAGFDLVTPNEREARWATGWQDLPVRMLAGQVQQQGCFPRVLVTRARDGLVGFEGNATCFEVPALATHVVDPVGAGDALLAYATVALKVTGSLLRAAWLGSVAAAIACSRQGNAPVLASEVREWLERL